MKELIAFQLSIIIALIIAFMVIFMMQTEKMVEAYGANPIHREWWVNQLDIANPKTVFFYEQEKSDLSEEK